MKNKDLEQEQINSANLNDLQTAEGCLISAQQSFTDNKIDEALYWLAMADIHCKLILARKANAN